MLSGIVELSLVSLKDIISSNLFDIVKLISSNLFGKLIILLKLPAGYITGGGVNIFTNRLFAPQQPN